MFGSRKGDEKTVKRRFWPWGRRQEEQSQPEEAVEDAPEIKQPAPVEEVVDTETAAPQEQIEVSSAQAELTSAAVAEETAEQTPEPLATVDDIVAKEPIEVAKQPIEVAEQLVEVEELPVADIQVQPVLEASVAVEAAVEPEPLPEELPEAPVKESGGFFARMKKGLSKTRSALVEGVAEIFVGKKEIDDELLEELETQLLVADVGVEATSEIIGKLTKRVKYRELDDADALMQALKTELKEILVPADEPLVIDEKKVPYVILVVGVNGVGKTTTIGKMARKLQSEGKKVMLAAGDTFRAAAVEQLQVWGERNDIPVVAQHTGADSASVIYDAFEAAKARGADVLIADTAGRLHNKENLMEELRKVKRVLGKHDETAPHEVLLVLDAGTGQNALSQAKLFHETVQLTGMALTKLDGTAKGGVIFALSKQMQLPIRFLGVGEQIDDLRPFSAGEFVDALFDTANDGDGR